MSNTYENNECNIKKLNISKKYPVEAKLYNEICDLIEKYNGELSLVSVIGILELKIQSICGEQNE